jgi:hypothetical protein
VIILGYLRAKDLVNCLEVDKTVFARIRVRAAIRFQIRFVYESLPFGALHTAPQGTPSKTRFPVIKEQDLRCDLLYCREMKSILAALTHSSPALTKGYWASTSWISNAKKYIEGEVLYVSMSICIGLMVPAALPLPEPMTVDATGRAIVKNKKGVH